MQKENSGTIDTVKLCINQIILSSVPCAISKKKCGRVGPLLSREMHGKGDNTFPSTWLVPGQDDHDVVSHIEI